MAEESRAPEAVPKPRIFISYSRKDMAFTDRLDAALRARGFETLIDRTEIYAFEDWWNRIKALISRADSVVFVLSPDAVMSEVALKEVAHAALLHKRFAPIVCRRVDAKTTPDALRQLNFIFFDDPASFDAAADRLAEALHTDIGWIRHHTEFGEAARAWAEAGHAGGLLLRSPLLEQAEHWIASRPHGAPEPTEETRAFITASRRQTTLRRNVLVGSLAAGLVVALVLAGIAFWQRGNARTEEQLARTQETKALAQEKIATEQRETALATRSRLLAVQAARATKEGDPQTAILLSLEALRSPDDKGPDRYDVEVEKTLLDALYRNPLRAIIRADSNKFVKAAFVAGDAALAAIAADGGVTFWSLDDGGHVLGKIDLPVGFGPVTKVHAALAQPILIFERKDNSYFAWNFKTRDMVPGVTGACSKDDGGTFRFDPAGKRLFVVCEGVSIFDLAGGPVRQVPGPFDLFALAPNGAQFAVSADQTITVMDTATAAVVSTWREQDDEPVQGLAISFDSKMVLATNYGGVRFYDAKTGTVAQPLMRTQQARTFGIDVSRTQGILVVTSGDDNGIVWNFERSAPIQIVDGSVLRFLPSGLLVSQKDTTITLWGYGVEGHTGTTFPIRRADLSVASDHSFAAGSADGRKIVTLGDAGDLYVWSTDPAMLLQSIADKGEQLGAPVALSANGAVAATTSDSGITVWDIAKLGAGRHIDRKGQTWQVALSDDGRRLAVVGQDNRYDIIDVATLRSIKPAGFPAGVTAAAFSADGETIAFGQTNALSLWRVTDGSKLFQCAMDGTVGRIVWIDADRVAYALDDGTVSIMTPKTCQATEVFSFDRDDDDSYADIRVKQGVLLANLSNRVQIWSIAENKQIFDTTRKDWPVFDESQADSTRIEPLPNRRIIVGKQPDKELDIYDLATRDKILTFAIDTADCCAPDEIIAPQSGDRLLTLWRDRDALHLRVWRLFPSIAEASAFAKSNVPECLAPQQRKEFGLASAPPRWCIEMRKRPYDSDAWRRWLADRDAGKATPEPQ